MAIELKDSVTVIDYNDGLSGWLESITRQWAISASREIAPSESEWADEVVLPTTDKPYSWIKDTKIRTISNPGIPYYYADEIYYFGPLAFVDKSNNQIEFTITGSSWSNAKSFISAENYMRISSYPANLVIREIISFNPICQNGKDGADGAPGVSPSYYSIVTSSQTYTAGKSKKITYYINEYKGNEVTQISTDRIALSADDTDASKDFLISLSGDFSNLDTDKFYTNETSKQPITITLSKREDEKWVVVDAETIDSLAAGTYAIILDNDTVSRPKSKTTQDTVAATLYYGELKVVCDWSISPSEIWVPDKAKDSETCSFSGIAAGSYTISATVSNKVVATKIFRVIEIEEGLNAKYVVLSSNATAFVKGSDNAVAPDSITIAADVINAIDTDKVTYTWYKDNTEIANANSATLSVSKSGYSGQHVYKCVVNINGRQSEDSVTIPLLVNGSNGSNGEDAYTIILKNESFNVPVTFDNKIPAGGTTLVIEPLVWKGTTEKTDNVSNLQITIDSTGNIDWFTVDNEHKKVTLTGGKTIPNNRVTGTMTFVVDTISFEKSFTIIAVPAGKDGADGKPGADGAPGVSPSYYSIESDSMIHRGTLQKENVTFRFYETIGDNKQISQKGYIYYGFGSAEQGPVKVSSQSSVYTIQAGVFKNKYEDLVIEWWSDVKTDTKAILYDAETIEFVSRSYTLALSQNNTNLPADSDGNVLSFSNAKISAQLYLDGEELPDKSTSSNVGVAYSWKLSNNNNGTGTANGKTFSLSELTSDSIMVTCTAKYYFDGIVAATRTATAIFIKVKNGANGDPGKQGDSGASAVQYVIETNYDEIGVAYAAVTNGDIKSKQLQYYPNGTIKVSLKRIEGTAQSYITNGTIGYDIQASSKSTDNVLPLTGKDTEFGVGQWEAIKFEDDSTTGSTTPEQKYSSYTDKERYIYLYYKEKSSNVILAEKYIYLVHAKSNILANFETTAFGFNDLTADGTKGIKFTADGGMELFAGDAKVGKDMFTIWSGKAIGGEHGDKVFYVDNGGNLNLSGNVTSKKGERIINFFDEIPSKKRDLKLYNSETKETTIYYYQTVPTWKVKYGPNNDTDSMLLQSQKIEVQQQILSLLNEDSQLILELKWLTSDASLYLNSIKYYLEIYGEFQDENQYLKTECLFTSESAESSSNKFFMPWHVSDSWGDVQKNLMENYNNMNIKAQTDGNNGIVKYSILLRDLIAKAIVSTKTPTDEQIQAELKALKSLYFVFKAKRTFPDFIIWERYKGVESTYWQYIASRYSEPDPAILKQLIKSIAFTNSQGFCFTKDSSWVSDSLIVGGAFVSSKIEILQDLNINKKIYFSSNGLFINFNPEFVDSTIVDQPFSISFSNATSFSFPIYVTLHSNAWNSVLWKSFLDEDFDYSTMPILFSSIQSYREWNYGDNFFADEKFYYSPYQKYNFSGNNDIGTLTVPKIVATAQSVAFAQSFSAAPYSIDSNLVTAAKNAYTPFLSFNYTSATDSKEYNCWSLGWHQAYDNFVIYNGRIGESVADNKGGGILFSSDFREREEFVSVGYKTLWKNKFYDFFVDGGSGTTDWSQWPDAGILHNSDTAYQEGLGCYYVRCDSRNDALIKGFPSQYGLIINFPASSEGFQLYHQQTGGHLYMRGSNASGGWADDIHTGNKESTNAKNGYWRLVSTTTSVKTNRLQTAITNIQAGQCVNLNDVSIAATQGDTSKHLYANAKAQIEAEFPGQKYQMIVGYVSGEAGLIINSSGWLTNITNKTVNILVNQDFQWIFFVG